jgi:RNA polymerase sigma-70 factor (ECF subfamily)
VSYVVGSEDFSHVVWIQGNMARVPDIDYVVNKSQRLEALFEAHYRDLAAYARRRGLAPADADDLTANVFVVAWRRIDDVPNGEEALMWLYGVAFNELRNFRRTTRRRTRLVARLASTSAMPAPEDPTDVSANSIRAALDALSSGDREIVLLASGEGLSASQLGTVLGCSEIAARTRLHRARARLADLLEIDAAMQRPRRVGHEVHVWSEVKEMPQ